MNTNNSMRIEKELQLANLLGYNTARKVSSSCRGKWAGTTDYSLLFEDENELFISNGMIDYMKKLEEFIKQYQSFKDNYTSMLERLKIMQINDNKTALKNNLKPYEIIDIRIAKNNDDFGWAYVALEIDNKIINFMETGLRYALLHNLEGYNKSDFTQQAITQTEWYTDEDGKRQSRTVKVIDSKLFTNGGLDKKNCDFVFAGTAHKINSLHQLII